MGTGYLFELNCIIISCHTIQGISNTPSCLMLSSNWDKLQQYGPIDKAWRNPIHWSISDFVLCTGTAHAENDFYESLTMCYYMIL